MPFTRPGFVPIVPPPLNETLVGDMVGVADELRDMLADFGAVNWRVTLVHATKGTDGVPVVFSRVELKPTPTVEDARARDPQTGGIVDNGQLNVRGISLTYTEDQLLGRGTGGVPMPADGAFWWELQTFDQENDSRIRCFVDKLVRDQIGVQWTATLTAQRPTPGRHS